MHKEQEFEAFLNITENRSRILAVIIAMVQDFSVAEDLFQETVLQILRSNHLYDQDRAFLPWACGIARNVVKRHWRTSQKQPLSMAQEALSNLAELAVEDDPDLWREERVALHHCLKKMPDRFQRLFVLRYAHNYKGKDLSERVDIRTGSIRTTLARLRGKLRQCISMHIEMAD
ncbi:MAG: sigma-70 family RNA polymerase sigma factor [Phycisphaerae bacterium]|nr:sigma-70 family RNA polymerase sigma factor [Phycisphaerae bacterium]